MKRVKDCPICGSQPILKVIDLEKPLGRGYPGCFSIVYYCPKCGMIESNGSNTIYNEMEKAQEIAKTSWNEAVKKVKRLMGGRKK